MRDDLIGIGLVLLGILLFLMVVIPQQAFVSAGIASVLRHVLGLGAFVLPVALVAWGISYFLKPQECRLWRFVLGVSLILLALMGVFSCVTYQVSGCTEPSQLFSEPVLVGGGGYVGSGLSWCLVSALGLVISYVVFAFVIIIGLVLAGFSISSAFLFARNLAQERRKDRQAAKELQDGFEPQVRKGAALSYTDEEALDEQPRADETVVLGNKRGRKQLPTFSAGSFNQDDYTQACQDELFDGEDPTDAAAPTQVLPGKRRGAKTVKLSKKGKDEAAAAEEAKTVKLGAAPAVPEGAAPAATEGFVLPDLSLLKVSGKRNRSALNAEFKDTATLLQQTLEEFSVPARVVGWLAGPTVTLFKVELPSGVKLSKLTGLADDIALALAASSVRIAQIPNTSLVGVEIPNKQRQDVLLGDIIPSCGDAPLDMAIGEDIDGNGVCVNLAKMPHLLIGGTTGSGKSVCINSMIMSIITRATPAEVRMILIDPKRIEFSQYNGIPHLYVPVVTEPKEAAAALRWGVVEMERRLKVFETVGARNIGFYNQKIQNGELDSEEGERPSEMPYIVIVIDELSDLMMAAGKDVEDSIVRISQLARAAGIHLIVATQRPSSNVVTGMIKANITNRIALLVATGVDSRVILDASGAEKLVGHGDMLFNKPEWGKPKRIQGCFVSDEEINQVVAHLKEQGTPEYHPEILQMKVEGGSASGASTFEDIQEDDPLIWEAADAVVQSGLGSTSMLQRRLKVGYARAGRIMDMLENKGIVGPPDGSRAREVLIDSVEDLEAIKAFEMADGEGF
ncbi:MAG: DNA translocase FtsK 4TM domain-containing protein [Coriobacteriales bacterium]